MDSRELAMAVARRANIDIQSARRAVEALAPVVSGEIRKGGSVRLGSLGTFKIKKVEGRTYRDVRTKEIKQYQASKHLIFDTAAAYKKVR